MNAAGGFRPARLLASLVLAGLFAVPADAAAQGGGAGRNQGLQQRSATAFPAAMRLTPSAREALRRWLCPNGGAPAPGAPGRCDGLRRDARTASPAPAASDVAGWFRDLPPARGGQRACPEGTRPAPAHDRPDTVRCLPG